MNLRWSARVLVVLLLIHAVGFAWVGGTFWTEVFNAPFPQRAHLSHDFPASRPTSPEGPAEIAPEEIKNAGRLTCFMADACDQELAPQRAVAQGSLVTAILLLVGSLFLSRRARKTKAFQTPA